MVHAKSAGGGGGGGKEDAIGGLEGAREDWKRMYATLLPCAARSRAATQVTWPVSLDHCFARIILDHVVGVDVPWTAKIKSPAYRNMSVSQLRSATNLGKRILEGTEDLRELNRRSLELREKNGPKRKAVNEGGSGTEKKKQVNSDGDRTWKGRSKDDEGDESCASQRKKVKREDEQVTKRRVDSDTMDKVDDHDRIRGKHAEEVKEEEEEEDTSKEMKSTSRHDEDEGFDISVVDAADDLTPYRRRVLKLLYTVPRGRWTTYKAMSDALQSSPRAVGNAMRNNPYAPQIPCHRVLAGDATLGGFGGDWGVDGRHAKEKMRLLRSEGVQFDGKGKAVGRAYTFSG